MQPPSEVLRIHAAPHPNPKVHRAGFPLDDPYVEHVWAERLGPSTLLILRRMSELWREREPAVVNIRELGQSLGLGQSISRHRPTWHSIERLVDFGLAHWLPGGDLAVHTEVAPLSPRQLRRVTDWTRQAHDRLLAAHLDRLAATHQHPTLAARLDQLEHPRASAPTRGLSR